MPIPDPTPDEAEPIVVLGEEEEPVLDLPDQTAIFRVPEAPPVSVYLTVTVRFTMASLAGGARSRGRRAGVALDLTRVPGQSGGPVLRLLLLFTTVPLLELALLLWIGSEIGVAPTVALILFTGVLGAGLARHQGLATWARFQGALSEGRLPTEELLEGLLILVAGAVLLTPGVLTDAAGFLLLVPAARRRIVHRMERHLRRRVVVHGAPTASRVEREEPEVVDVDFRVADEDGESRS